jgi:hypothetical protein
VGIEKILEMGEGPERTAALAAWFQGLYREERDKPVLVGGAALELYTRGAYRTGDLDFVGHVPPDVEGMLREAGFRPIGRHWVHPAGRLFIELPSRAFDAPIRKDLIRLGDWVVLALSPEDVLVDRLAAWKFWNVVADGVNAFLLWKDRGESLDREHLERRARQEGVVDALGSLRTLAARSPKTEEVEEWARRSR